MVYKVMKSKWPYSSLALNIFFLFCRSVLLYFDNSWSSYVNRIFILVFKKFKNIISKKSYFDIINFLKENLK